MGSCSTKQEVVSQTSATGTPVAIVLRPTGIKQGSKVHASDSLFRSRTDSKSFRSRADSKSLAKEVSEQIAKAGDKMKENIDGSKTKNDKIKHNSEKGSDGVKTEKLVKQNGSQTDHLRYAKSDRKRNRQSAKAMRIGDFAVIVEFKDHGMYPITNFCCGTLSNLLLTVPNYLSKYGAIALIGLIVLIPDHCLFIFFYLIQLFRLFFDII